MTDMHIHIKNGIYVQKIFDDYVKKCIDMDLKKVVFLDHGNRVSTKHREVLSSKESILAFDQMINKFRRESSNLTILKGIEIDYSNDINFRRKTLEILNLGKFEWVVGAIHSLKFNNTSDYLNAVIDMINNYKIHCVAHIKLEEDYHLYMDLLKYICKLCSSKNIFIEINTSDRSIWTDEQMIDMINLFDEFNVQTCFSSDAHCVDEIGYKIKETKRKILQWQKEKLICGYCMQD